ncbi:MAG: four helix bundle protein [Candidatus Doudnabacteria bacterium]|nr:four helix bundle protein [Candidatus Doudnabacteria bacterium]
MQNNSAKVKIDLKARAYRFALDVISFVNKLDQKNLSVQVMAKQVLRSATSIGANIIEAQAGRTKKDFTNFFTHALKSSNETKFWLGLLIDSGLAPKEEANRLLQEATEIANILGASVLTLKGKF